MVTFKKYGQDFLSEMGYRWSESTKGNYQSRFNVLVALVDELVEKDIQIQDIKPRQLNVIAGALYKNGSHSRAVAIMGLFVSILNDGYRNGDVPKQFEWVAVKQQQKKPVSPMSPDEVRKVIGKVDKHYQPIFWFLYCTGCRPCEALALTWGDVEPDFSKVHISKGQVRGRQGATKTKKYRSVVLSRKIRHVLAALERGADTDPVFVGKKGAPLKGHLDRIWRNAGGKTDIEHRPSYNLKHSFTSAALYNGVSMPIISRMLGHSNMSTTFRFYAGMNDDMSKSGEEKLENMFSDDEGQTA